MSSYDDLLADIDLAPRRRWTDLYQERRAIPRPSSPNGRVHGTYTHVCASCGTEFTSNRRAVPGKKSWCGKPECRKVAAAERAQAYRARQSGGE